MFPLFEELPFDDSQTTIALPLEYSKAPEKNRPKSANAVVTFSKFDCESQALPFQCCPHNRPCPSEYARIASSELKRGKRKVQLAPAVQESGRIEEKPLHEAPFHTAEGTSAPPSV